MTPATPSEEARKLAVEISKLDCAQPCTCAAALIDSALQAAREEGWQQSRGWIAVLEERVAAAQAAAGKAETEAMAAREDERQELRAVVRQHLLGGKHCTVDGGCRHVGCVTIRQIDAEIAKRIASRGEGEKP